MIRSCLLLVLTVLLCCVTAEITERAAREADELVVDHYKLLKTNAGYRNLTRDGVPQKRVVGVISAASLGFSILKGVADQIDVDRACIVGFANKGSRKLVNPEWHLNHGIIHQPLPREMDPGKAGVFTFEKSTFTGTSGMFTYNIADSDIKVAVMWSVPLFYGFYANKFDLKLTNNITASKEWYNAMYDSNSTLTVWNGGHWLTRNYKGVDINGAMTNNGKASLLVDVVFNI